MPRILAFLAAMALAAPALASPPSPEPPLAVVTPVGPAETVFDPKRDACDGDDLPDTAARAFRDAEGAITLFAMHTLNRALRGPDFASLKIDCRSPLRSGHQADPALYDDASWITATWTEDGRRVAGLVHHEFQAHAHEGRCRHKEYLPCWYNTITGVESLDGGRSFERGRPPAVMAAAPFRQETGQGRHRGFFNPSNIFGDGPERYVLVSTTGWAGQDSGPCLFRTRTPFDPGSWRAYDGTGFTVRLPDPYREAPKPKPCVSVRPFPAPVGGVVRHRGTGAWVAVFQASADGAEFPEAGFYATASRDLLRWDKPRLVLSGSTLYDDPCGTGGRMIAYPSLIDSGSTRRNFDDVGDTADLYYSELRVDGCQITADRQLKRRRVAVRVLQ